MGGFWRRELRLKNHSRRFAARARAAGVDVDVQLWDDLVHVWHFSISSQQRPSEL
jgi:hypothetical protein